jgi:diacylglycerol kinase family enzyme
VDWTLVFAIAGAVVALVGAIALVIVSLRLRRVKRTLARAAQLRRDSPAADRVAFVANPSKTGYDDFKQAAHGMCHDLGLSEPLWFDTTIESPGTDQAKQAAAAGRVRTVVAAGGDGTVRAVAHGLAGGDVPMGIVPLGTANLLARNLGLPMLSARDALEVALTGHRRRIDVGRLSAADAAGQSVFNGQTFLVISGLGFDAAMVSGTDSGLKRRLGWPAYFISGINHLSGKPIKASITVDGSSRTAQVRSAMVGNCGLLPAGLTLVPDADLADGQLDLAVAETRHGLIGWAALAFQVLLHSVGLRWSPAWASGRMVYRQGERIAFSCEDDQLVQIDGELVGKAATLEAWVEPLALSVRVAKQAPETDNSPA